MMKSYYHEKISLLLSFFILSNYLFLNLSFSELIIKINFSLFFLVIIFFYLTNIKENIYFKIFFLLIVFLSLGVATSEWDPRSIWLFHAKRIFYDGSIFSLSDNYAPFSHNSYPMLTSSFASSFAVLVGNWNEVFPKISFSLMFLPPLILIYSFLNSNNYIIFLSIIFFTIGKFLFNGWVDGLVAVYFCVSTLLMYKLFISNDVKYKKLIYYLLSLSFFITLTLIKNEGTVLLFILFLIVFLNILYVGNKNKNTSKLFYLTISFVPIILWKFYCYSNGIHEYHLDNDVLSNLSLRISEMENFRLIAYFLFLNEKFYICLSLFLISFWTRINKELFFFIFFIVFTYIIVLFFIFLSTPADFYFQLNSAAARIIKSLSLLLAFFALYNYNYKNY